MPPWKNEQPSHYAALGVHPNAHARDIRTAYLTRARHLHPDKGGDTVAFTRLRTAYETLIDPASRKNYDAFGLDQSVRHPSSRDIPVAGQVPHHGPAIPRGDATELLLNVLTTRHAAIDATRQLVLLWHLKEHLARAEMQRKKLWDARAREAADPWHRSEKERQVLREFRVDAQAAVVAVGNGACAEEVHAQYAFTRFYLWHQSPYCVYIALHAPTAFQNVPVDVTLRLDGMLRVQPRGGPPVLCRHLAGEVDSTCSMTTYSTEDCRYWVLVLPKAKPHHMWPRLFRGDPLAARCLAPPYTCIRTDTEVLLHLPLPGWVTTQDVQVDMHASGVVVVDGPMGRLVRTVMGKGGQGSTNTCTNECSNPLDVANSSWEVEHIDGRKVLVVTMALTVDPLTAPLTKHAHPNTSSRTKNNTNEHQHVFVEDGDEFGLLPLLQAAMFVATGAAYVPPSYARGSRGHTVTHLAHLSDAARAFARVLMAQQDAAEQGDVADG